MPIPAKKWAKSRIFIGTNSTALGSESLWTEILGVRQTTGQVGSTYRTVDTSQMDTIDDTSAKTTRGFGTFGITYVVKLDDAGQMALQAAADDLSDKPFNFKMELDDDAPSSGNNPTRFAFTAHVTANIIGAPNRQGIVEGTATLMPQSAAVRTAAAA